MSGKVKWPGDQADAAPSTQFSGRTRGARVRTHGSVPEGGAVRHHLADAEGCDLGRIESRRRLWSSHRCRLRTLRRTGGGLGCHCKLRASSEARLLPGQRPTANGQRPTANGQRPTANGQRPTLVIHCARPIPPVTLAPPPDFAVCRGDGETFLEEIEPTHAR